jgi:pSer/pThr/pTyr-binding forkhead associated (FHA) protein
MCGRENPGHLMFCQECGQRLAPVAPSPSTAGGATPTSPLAATGALPVAGGKQPAPPTRTRPAAPEVSFTKRGEAALPGAPSLPLERTGSAASPMGTCPLCGTANEHGVHFCVTCGQPLVEAQAGAGRLGAIDLNRTVAAPSKPERAPLPGTGAPFIEPARVIEVGPAASPRSQDGCPRCGGTRDTGAQFCRFCGLPLASPTPPGASAVAHGLEPASSVADAGPARIVLITRDGSEGPSYSLGAVADLGRTEGNILFPDDQFVSPRHARIVARGGEFFVRDLESTNGVFVRIPFLVRGDAGGGKEDKTTVRGHHTEALSVDGEVVGREQPLADQELFLVGQQVLRFEVVKQAEEAFGAASENGTLLFGTPAAPRYARLSQRTVEGVVRDVFHLRRAETVIGRESGDIVFTDDPFLSRRHAVVRMQGVGAKRRFTLADLGSSNGTFLRIRDEVRLRFGDHFRIGQQLMRFDSDAGRTGV